MATDVMEIALSCPVSVALRLLFALSANMISSSAKTVLQKGVGQKDCVVCA
jgi:hypothetical protein